MDTSVDTVTRSRPLPEGAIVHVVAVPGAFEVRAKGLPSYSFTTAQEAVAFVDTVADELWQDAWDEARRAEKASWPLPVRALTSLNDLALWACFGAIVLIIFLIFVGLTLADPGIGVPLAIVAVAAWLLRRHRARA